MEAINRVFEYCKHCDGLLSGQQRKFCTYECGDIYRALKTRETNGYEILETLKSEALLIDHLKLNSSIRAYNEAINLL